MHGGAAGSGAPLGNKNALRHGRYSQIALDEKRNFRQLIRESEELLRFVGQGLLIRNKSPR